MIYSSNDKAWAKKFAALGYTLGILKLQLAGIPESWMDETTLRHLRASLAEMTRTIAEHSQNKNKNKNKN